MESVMTASTEPAFRAVPETEARPATSLWLVIALVVAVLGLAGSLYLSLGLQLKACPLCFYQRTFMMSLVAVLGIGLMSGLGRSGRLGLLAFPLAVAGLGVALFHVYLEMVGKLECPAGLLGLSTVPRQSALVFSLLAVLLLSDVRVNPEASRRWPTQIAGVLLGGVLAWFSCISNPPMPPPPIMPYQAPPDVCRPPYQPQ
jgi:disulfide bond formation protein DsbB